MHRAGRLCAPPMRCFRSSASSYVVSVNIFGLCARVCGPALARLAVVAAKDASIPSCWTAKTAFMNCVLVARAKFIASQ